MALFTKKDLIAYRERVDLQLSILPLSPVFTTAQKQTVAIIYNQLIEILDEAITTQIEVIAPELI
jgi:hypothetical protein